MHENMKTSMWHTGRSERTWRLPACFCNYCYCHFRYKIIIFSGLHIVVLFIVWFAMVYMIKTTTTNYSSI